MAKPFRTIKRSAAKSSVSRAKLRSAVKKTSASAKKGGASARKSASSAAKKPGARKTAVAKVAPLKTETILEAAGASNGARPHAGIGSVERYLHQPSVIRRPAF